MGQPPKVGGVCDARRFEPLEERWASLLLLSTTEGIASKDRIRRRVDVQRG